MSYILESTKVALADIEKLKENSTDETRQVELMK